MVSRTSKQDDADLELGPGCNLQSSAYQRGTMSLSCSPHAFEWQRHQRWSDVLLLQASMVPRQLYPLASP